MPKLGINDVSLRRIERQLTHAKDAGYRFVPAAELAAADQAVPVAGDLRIALTFDDGFRSVLTTVAPLLRDLDIPWTAFVVSGFADGAKGYADFLDWAEIEMLAGDGVTIASHSVTHPNFSTLAPGQVVDEIERSRTALRERIGIDTTEFAIPFGQSGSRAVGQSGNAQAQAAAVAAGYDTVYAQSVERWPARSSRSSTTTASSGPPSLAPSTAGRSGFKA